jgi:hypothetical protein
MDENADYMRLASCGGLPQKNHVIIEAELAELITAYRLRYFPFKKG